jgi:hypothetical protein
LLSVVVDYGVFACAAFCFDDPEFGRGSNYVLPAFMRFESAFKDPSKKRTDRCIQTMALTAG